MTNRFRRTVSVIGALCFCSAPVRADFVVNGGFEVFQVVPDIHDVPGDGIPALGFWYGDPADIVTAENGVVPPEGVQMLRFGGGSGTQTDIWQFITTPPTLRGQTITFEAYFNAVPFGGVVPISLAGVVIGSTDTVLSDGSHFPVFSSDAERQVNLDNAPSTWELLAADFYIPVSSQSLGFKVYGSTQTNQHTYADSVSIRLSSPTVPEPSNLTMCSLITIVAISSAIKSRRGYP